MNFLPRMNTDGVVEREFGLRRQSVATTALSNSVGGSLVIAPPQSGVALRFPPQSKTCGHAFPAKLFLSVTIRGSNFHYGEFNRPR
jgi:hypothetical protein